MLATAHYYENVRTDPPYTHKQQVKIRSLGTFYDGLRVPDVLLTALYRMDPKTGMLIQNVKLYFQTDGPSDAQLNFKHGALTDGYVERIYNFDVNMDVLFGEGVVKKNGGKVGANIGAERGIKGGLDIGIETSEELPGTRTSLHGRIKGMLSANEHILEAWGWIV